MVETPVTKPFRAEAYYGVRPLQALKAGCTAALVLLAAYYLTLALLPGIFAWPTTLYPVAAWAHRFDLAQYLGTIPFPPLPTPLTWWVGLGIWFGTLSGCGLVYAILLSWTLQSSDTIKGVGFGIALCLALLALLTLAQGYHPAVMRNALPDVGVLMLGWSVWAPFQLLSVFIVYGAILGKIYQRPRVRKSPE
jgi:hypothetical protein